MNYYLEALEATLVKNWHEVMDLVDLNNDVSPEFRNIVLEEGQEFYTLTDDDVASTYLYFGQHYFNDWKDDKEIGNAMLRELVVLCARDTKFA